jgi:hypothetical protein
VFGFSDMPARPSNVCLWGKSGKHRLSLSISPFDPKRTNSQSSIPRARAVTLVAASSAALAMSVIYYSTALVIALVSKLGANGLRRKATQPTFVACVRMASLSAPVMKMTGSCDPSDFSRSRSSMPDMPLKFMSRTRHAAPFDARASRNASADVKTCIRARLYAATGQTRRASDDFTAILAEDPNDAEASNGLRRLGQPAGL